MSSVGAREAGYTQAQKLFAAGKVPPVVVLAGPETLQAEELTAALRAAVVAPEMEVFNYNRYKAGQDDASVIFGTAGTLPAFAERRLVVVEEASEFDRREMEELARYVDRPCKSTILLLRCEATGEKLPAALKRVKARFTLWRPFPAEAVTWAMNRAKALGKSLPKAVAEELYGLCGGDSGDGRASLSDLNVELEKLTLCAGERKTINSDDLQVVGRHAEARVLYQVEAAVGARDLAAALTALEAALLFPKENAAIRIVTMLGERFRKMLVVRDRLDAGQPQREAMAGFWFPGRDGGSEFLAGVRRFRRGDLVQAMIELAQLDRALKSGQAEPTRLHLELAMRKICGVPAAGAVALKQPASPPPSVGMT